MNVQTQTLIQNNTLSEEHAKHGSYIPIELRTQHQQQTDNNDDWDVLLTDETTSSTPEKKDTSSAEDPYNFRERFVKNQQTFFRTAVKEIRNGRKETHWFWFVLPTSPYVVNGVEQGSRTNRYFTLRSDEEVLAYLDFKTLQGVHLRKNYLTILSEIKDQMTKKRMRNRKTLEELFPPKDVPKAVASFCLFERVARENGDHEVFQVCYDVLALHEKNKNNLSLFQKIRNKLGGKVSFADNSDNTNGAKKATTSKQSRPRTRHTMH